MPFAILPTGRTIPLVWRLVVVLAVAVILVALIKGWPVLYPRVSARASLAPDCDLRAGPCTVRFAHGGRVTLAVTPRALPTLQPLTFSVWLSGLPAPHMVELDLVGVDMNMGFNRFRLFADPVAAPPEEVAASHAPEPQIFTYRGTGMLPVCVRDRMAWEARVLLDLPAGLLLAPFRFETFRAAPAVPHD
ncbi:MAG: hypothetical protein EA400_03770 [Chromatiaceae bacterium]|nr:MAG: hypothetical protein EA400_03770 [Chromatiaceae bacterium]